MTELEGQDWTGDHPAKKTGGEPGSGGTAQGLYSDTVRVESKAVNNKSTGTAVRSGDQNGLG